MLSEFVPLQMAAAYYVISKKGGREEARVVVNHFQMVAASYVLWTQGR